MLRIDLSGKIAVITGGSGKMGGGLVRGLARAGADVAIHYHRNEAKARQLLTEIREMGGRGLIVQADVTRSDSVLAMRDAIVKGLGPAQIVVAGAVALYPWKTVLEQPPADFESQFRSSVLHTVFLAQAFIPGMIAKNWGRIIGISTEIAMQTRANCAAYTAGKRGMDGVLRTLVREVGAHGITVNQVAPGWTITDDSAAAPPQRRKDVPLGRSGTHEEVANLVAFLASDLAGYITGAFIPVSGGTIMPAI